MKKKILILALSVICLALLLGGMLAANADEGAATDIPGHNLALEEGVHIVYYVDQTVPAGAEAGVLCWEAPQESYTLENKQHQIFQNGTYTRGGNTYARYELPLPAKKMTVDIYAVSYVKVGDQVIYSELDKYSVLQYCYNKKGSTSIMADGTATLGELVTDILNYGKTAQKYFNYNTGRLANADYYQINVVNGTLEDGTTAGLYQSGKTILLTAPAPDCHQVVWTNSANATVGVGDMLNVSATAKAETYTAMLESHHNYSDWIIDQESTCTVNGSKHKICADCGDTLVEEILAPGHVYVSHSKITPTCTEPGMKAHYTCSTCGAYFTATRQETTKEALKISELGHSYSEWIDEIPATMSSEGTLGHYHCDDCGRDFDENYNEIDDLTIPALPFYSQGLKYVSNNDGTCNVAGIGTCTDTNVVIPPVSPSGDSVTGIEKSAFYNCRSIKSVTIPDNTTNIGSYAFYNCSIEHAIIPASAISSIPKERLKTVVITSGTSIESYAFKSCKSLTSITIPDSVTSIGVAAFKSCKSLTSITIPDSVTSIGVAAFNGCESFTSITIPDSVTSIGGGAFNGCSSLTNITIPFVGIEAGVTSSDGHQYPFGYIFGDSSYTGGTATIQSAFYNGTTRLESVTFYIPTSLKSVTVTGGYIPYGAFYNCFGLTTVTLGNNVTSISRYAFYGCSSLESITFPVLNNRLGYIFGNSSYTGGTATNQPYSNSSATTIYYIPTSLKSVTVTSGYIRYGAFYNCSGLTSITLGDNVTGIGEQAFFNCSSLKSITIPDSVTSIGKYAFRDCTSLTSITIPDSVTSIEEAPFIACSFLESITVAEGNPAYHSAENCLIETATGDLIAGCMNSIIPDNGSVTSIGDQAFYKCFSLMNVTIPDSVTNIGIQAFYECSSLTSVTIGNGVTNIGISAFNKCSSLQYNVYDNANYLGNANNLFLVLIESTDTSIASCNIHPNTKVIANCALSGCKSLTRITIPGNVTSIGNNAFCYCDSLTWVYFANTNGWYRTKMQSESSGTNMDVTFASTNATNLKSYDDYYWYRK